MLRSERSRSQLRWILLIVEVTPQPIHRLAKIADELVNIILHPGVIERALSERVIETTAEGVRAIYDALDELPILQVAGAVWPLGQRHQTTIHQRRDE